MKNPTYNNKASSLLAGGILLAALNLAGCKKLIEIPDNVPNRIVTSQVFSDSVNAIAAVVRLYVNFNSTDQTGFPAFGMTLFPALSADELRPTAIGNSLQKECFLNAIRPNNPSLSVIWNIAYGGGSGGIYQVNACIEGISASTTLSASIKKQLIGECKVVRAFYYFNLTNLWGPVPLVTSTDYQINQTLARAEVEKVYSQIIMDLKEAQQLLPAGYPSAGRARPNLYIATALLAKVYLYQQNWADAYDASNTVINSGEYAIEPDVNQVYLDASQEAIWRIPAAGSIPNFPTPDGNYFVPLFPEVYPDYVISSSLLNAFEPGDLRFINWVGFNTIGGVDYYYPYKYKNHLQDGSGLVNEDYTIIRLAEQYLIRAEAEANGQGDAMAGAIRDINVIRHRAGLPDTPLTAFSTREEMLSAILHERQVELFCEWGNRWLDLKRTGSARAVLSTEKMGTWLQDDHAALYPIPLSELQLNPFLTQNPGY